MKASVWAAAAAAVGFAFAPASAEQAVGWTSPGAMKVHLHAGPATRYPIIWTIPVTVPLTVYGCDNHQLWCDVEWRGERGWVYTPYLDFAGRQAIFFYVGQPIYVP